MSQQLISRSSDLSRLRAEGHDIAVVHDHLLVRQTPYVNSSGAIARGVLVCPLQLAGDRTAGPLDDHTVHFLGDFPCYSDGSPIEAIRNVSQTRDLAPGLPVQHTFSSKPVGERKYTDHHEKMTTYAAILGSPARVLDPDISARVYHDPTDDEAESLFHYPDTATARAGLKLISAKLEMERVAIVGVGGTGSYILDFISKTPIREIHVFDGDDFLNHNAYRAPSPPTLEQLRERPPKVDYFVSAYSRMRKGIIGHSEFIDADNVNVLEGMDFVFLCVDGGSAKKPLVEYLEAHNMPFIDVGMGIDVVRESLRGVVRVTASTPAKRDHFRGRVSLADTKLDEYGANIQLAELNALNAALAVVKWKKLAGFYLDLSCEHNSEYSLDVNALTSGDES